MTADEIDLARYENARKVQHCRNLMRTTGDTDETVEFIAQTMIEVRISEASIKATDRRLVSA